MKDIIQAGLLASALTIGAVSGAAAANARTYVLNGYSFGGMPGVNTAELAAKLKDHEGARITQADIDVDEAMLTKELQARRITGRLFTTLAERHGRVWIIFDLQTLDPPMARPGDGNVSRRLEVQKFEGASGIAAGDLAAATGLKQGDPLTPEKINAARRAIVASYARSMPGRAISITGRMQAKADGEVTLTWIIGDK